MSKITPFLWFDSQAEEAMHFYISLFPNSRVHSVSRVGEAGEVTLVSFELDGQPVMGINGGPHFKLTEAFSFYVDCADQAEVDRLWERLLEGGEAQQCGWLKDKYGLSWQVIPRELMELMQDPDPARAGRVMRAMLQMVKIDVEGLRRAHAGEED